MAEAEAWITEIHAYRLYSMSSWFQTEAEKEKWDGKGANPLHMFGFR